jgi:predicted GIY-YIG superfamily endonuclease
MGTKLDPAQFYSKDTLICEYKNCKRGRRKFAYECDINRHIRSVHLDEKRFWCAKCSASFWNNDGLRRHIIAVHQTLKGRQAISKKFIVCESCQKPFSCKYKLSRHLRFFCKVKHFGVPPKFYCKKCKKTFSSERYKRHLKTMCTPHAKEVDYKMNSDEQSYINKTVKSLYQILINVNTLDDLKNLQAIGNIGIYAIICLGCDVLYLGSTSDLSDRTATHRSHAKLGINRSFTDHGLICTTWELSRPILIHAELNPNLYCVIEANLLCMLGKKSKIMNKHYK